MLILPLTSVGELKVDSIKRCNLSSHPTMCLTFNLNSICLFLSRMNSFCYQAVSTDSNCMYDMFHRGYGHDVHDAYMDTFACVLVVTFIFFFAIQFATLNPIYLASFWHPCTTQQVQ